MCIVDEAELDTAAGNAVDDVRGRGERTRNIIEDGKHFAPC
jgi:hypothetical protein